MLEVCDEGKRNLLLEKIEVECSREKLRSDWLDNFQEKIMGGIHDRGQTLQAESQIVSEEWSSRCTFAF